MAKRQIEYVAGRHCALTAVRQLLPAFAGEIASDDRAPRWPPGIVGSITHSGDFAWAAVARDADVRSVGIDSELIPAAEGVDAIHQIVVCPGDELPEGGMLSDPARAALLFSAKESIFKCLFPLVKKMFSYEHARVSFALGSGSFTGILTADLDGEFVRGTRIAGVCQVDGDRVHSAMVLARV